MPLPNGRIGLNRDHPLVVSPFLQNWNYSTALPPPPSSLMITETGNPMITEVSIDYMITE